MRFEWDESKRRAVKRRHGIDFGDVARAFQGPVVEDYDYEHSETEDRWYSLVLLSGRVIIVSYAYRGEAIRLITARPASPLEAGRYWEAVFGDAT